MLKIWPKILIFIGLVIFLISCTDTVRKIMNADNDVRVEYSSCVGAGCHECVLEFECPADAIVIDTRTTTAVIDIDRCIQCYRCLNLFQCPENAITLVKDEIVPGEIADFSAVSDTLGELEISFIAPGDDGNSGLVHHYDMILTDQNENQLIIDFDVPLPLEAGSPEYWFLTGLPADELITVKVQAFDEAGQSSSPVTQDVLIAGIYVDDIPPAMISDLTAESQEEWVILTWTAPGDDGMEGSAQGYVLKYNQEEIDENNWESSIDLPLDITPSTSGTPEEVIITELPLQENCYLAIRAFDEESNYSAVSNNVLAIITGDVTPPAAIEDLNIVSTSPATLLLSWTAVGDNGMIGTAENYIIKVSTEEITAGNWDGLPEYEQSISPQPAGSSENFLLTGLEAVTNYFIAIKAEDEVGNLSPLSNVPSGSTSETPDETPPAAISDLEAIPSEIEIVLQWTSPGDDGHEGTAYYYEIRKSQNEINENNWEQADLLPAVPVPLPSGSEQDYTVTDLLPEQDYYFAMKSFDEAGNVSELSNVPESMLLIDETPPADISDLISSSTDIDITLQWTAPGDDGNDGTADHYEIRMNLLPIDESNWEDSELLGTPPDPQPAGNTEEFSVSGLQQEQEYYFAIKTYDDEGNSSGLSNLVWDTLETDIIPPADIDDLQIITGYSYNGSVTIHWTAPGDDGEEGTCSYYEVRIHHLPITETNWDQAEVAALIMDPEPAGSYESYVLYGLEQGVRFYLAIRAFDNNDNASTVSNSAGGKIVYQINAAPCNGCGNCVSACDVDAITDHGSWASINPDLCTACGDCDNYCPRNAIHLYVITY